MIPPFGPEGKLPPGVHWTTWEELVAHCGGTPHRQWLLDGLESAIEALRAAGCRAVYVDGSFVTAKEVPEDFDGCWDVMGVEPARLDPVLLRFDQGCAAQKAKYRGELFPAQLTEGGAGKTFLEFFQIDRESGNPKGMIALALTGDGGRSTEDEGRKPGDGGQRSS
ncbi:MAG: DUF6932 family protein [Ardenticatenaceae bacterium]